MTTETLGQKPPPTSFSLESYDGGRCVLNDLMQVMVEDQDIKAVWLDSRHRRVSFAFQPGADADAAEARLQDIVQAHCGREDCACQGEDTIDRPQVDSWARVCDVCENSSRLSVPQGLRVLPMPGAGVLLEKESCPTAPRFWNWQQFTWTVRPREYQVPDETKDLDEWKRHLASAVLCGVFGLIAAGVTTFAGAGAAWGVTLGIFFYVLSYVAGAWFPAMETWELLRKRVLDVHFLMLCVAAGAAVIGHWWEGAVLLFLFSLSGALEEFALARTEREIKGLFREAPKEANALINGREERVAVEQLRRGMTVRVRPGEQFPTDAEISTGKTAVNEANITGEATPVDKAPGDPVYSGTLNTWGSVDAQVTRPASESALARIIKLVQEARESKAPSQRLTDRFGTGYTYAILGLCLVMFLVWWLLLGHPPFLGGEENRSAFYLAMTLLVVASPCALVLSIPSAILAGIAAGARKGVLFRGGIAIEQLAEIRRVAFDKTGTLTTGELEVVKIEAFGGATEEEILQSAAALSHHSPHPVSHAITRRYKAKFSDADLPATADFRSLTGAGLEGTTAEGEPVKLGRRGLFHDQEWARTLPDPAPGLTETLVRLDHGYGRILLRDRVRDEAAGLLRELRREGLGVLMLTGDRQEAAALVATELEMPADEFQAQLEPEGKVHAIKNWQGQGHKVAMVGDGVNDAPSLAAADVSVGMGLRGSDTVLEQADVVLVKDKLENFLLAFRMSRFARSVIRQNLVISLGVILVMVLSALAGIVPLTLGVIAHEGSTVIVVLNSLRLLIQKPR